jgi:hypothetical protein
MEELNAFVNDRFRSIRTVCALMMMRRDDG